MILRLWRGVAKDVCSEEYILVRYNSKANAAYQKEYIVSKYACTHLWHLQGPKFCWHLDGYDKLSPFGFYIHGCIDGCVLGFIIAILNTILSVQLFQEVDMAESGFY